MKKIGCFRREGHVYNGEIVTISMHLHVRIVPVTYEFLPGVADFVIKQNRIDGFAPDLGKAWHKYTKENGMPYIFTEIDDPFCPQPIQAVLCDGGDDFYYLYWDRYTNGNHIAETLYAQEEPKPQMGIVRTPQHISDRFREMFATLTE